ncbi:YceI family protein [Candidatus Latescibacterota bacterium]
MIRSITRLAAAGALAVAALTTAAGAETYQIDTVHSSAEFAIRHLVSRTTGGFTDFAGTIVYDPEKPEATQIEGTIQVASIDTRNEKRDGHLKGPDFFDAGKYPTIAFKSSSTRSHDNHLMVTGNLTLHGTTRQIVLPVEVLGVGTHPRSGKAVAGFSAETTIRRSDYGVNNWTDVAGVLGDEVKVILTIEAGAQ